MGQEACTKIKVFGPKNSGKTCLIETHYQMALTLFIVEVITIDCEFQF